jgi:hypothetical protein
MEPGKCAPMMRSAGGIGQVLRDARAGAGFNIRPYADSGKTSCHTLGLTAGAESSGSRDSGLALLEGMEAAVGAPVAIVSTPGVRMSCHA